MNISKLAIVFLVLIPFTVMAKGRSKNDPKVETCDMIEYNIKLNEKTGEISFHQIILWDWNHEYSRYDVQGWEILDDSHVKNLGNILYEYGGMQYYVSPFKQKDRKIQTIQATHYRHTQTFKDPERENKKLFPEILRRFK